jgi:hypothetical protein
VSTTTFRLSRTTARLLAVPALIVIGFAAWVAVSVMLDLILG